MFLVKPELGLIFWSSVTFLILLFLLSKFAWKPILAALKEREQKISDSLELAEKTKIEMQAVQAGNERLLNEARMEREKILKEAKEMKETIIAQAKKAAEDESRKAIAQAKEAIDKEKLTAMAELKNTSAKISIEIAEKILRKKLEPTAEQDSLINEYLKQMNA
ncbi:MAG: F0F1 ATP synthase subunit B [Bacteroidetes bacterium]|nr:F0F1 ATP synthase subunit B [Bacteroidota bacterium]